jgi:predicted regulator of Ras-like GTPase activity (Roadblock/LC7/MglB family)
MGNMPRPKAEPYGVDTETLPGAGDDVFVQNPMREVEAIMTELRRVPDVLAVAVARRDGILIAPDLPRGVDPKKVAAMSAVLVGTSEYAARELGQGRFLQCIVDTDQGKILSTGAGEEALLVTLVRPAANLGLILLAVEKAARKLVVIFGRLPTGDAR